MAGASIGTVTVQLSNSSGGPLAGVPVSLSLIAGTLSGTLTAATNASGQAIFSNLNVQKTGTYQLLAATPDAVSATSNSFTITAGLAASIQVVGGGTPQSTQVLTPFAQPLAVKVADAYGNAVSGATVTYLVVASGASATLSGNTASTDSNGQASLTATANALAGSYSVSASVAGVATGATFALTNTTGAPGSLSFVQQPTDTSAGAAIFPPVVVKIVDGSGNPVSGAVITLALPGNATATGISDGSGQALFADLTIKTAGTYQLLASSGGISAVSATFNVTTALSGVFVSALSGDGQTALQAPRIAHRLRLWWRMPF